MTQVHQKPTAVAIRSPAKHTQAVVGTPRPPARPRKAAFSAEVFASEAAYDQSVASVVARIESGQVPPRQPDE